MRKFILGVLIIYGAMMESGLAQTQDKHATGDMFTAALNMMESQGMLDTMDPKKHSVVTDIHTDLGQVYVTVTGESGPMTMVYEPIVGKVFLQTR